MRDGAFLYLYLLRTRTPLSVLLLDGRLGMGCGGYHPCPCADTDERTTVRRSACVLAFLSAFIVSVKSFLPLR